MFGSAQKLGEKVSTTLYDLTHLEINTIVKDEMDASKAPASPRLLLHSVATAYHQKLVSLGKKYAPFLNIPGIPPEELFRGKPVFRGSGVRSFRELGDNADIAEKLLDQRKTEIPLPEDEINADIMMLKRIQRISADLKRILVMEGVDPCGEAGSGHDFDDPEEVKAFRMLPAAKAELLDLNLDLRQLLVIKKANDIGTERVVLQTIIGMDGDITTRIARSFASQPVSYIHQMHHEAISVSVDFWKSLIQVVVKLGESLIGKISSKS
jgi:hypothetical protein